MPHVFHRGARPERRVFLYCLFAFAIALCLAPATAFAGPALEIERSYTQPDGTTFQAGQRGDEYFHYVRTTEGFLVQKNPSDQTWYYVTSADSGFAFGSPANEAAPENALVPSVLANDAGKTAYAALGGRTYSGETHELGEVVTLSEIEAVQGTSDASAYGLKSAAQTETSLPLITIVIGFAGEEGSDPNADIVLDDGTTWTTAEQRYNDDYDWHDRLYGSENSITNYYATMSSGKFSWVPATAETSAYDVDGNSNVHDKAGDGVIHVTLNRNHGNWYDVWFASPKAADQRTAYVEALNEASKHIDFAAYDTNHNGILEKTEAGLLFIVAGYDASGGDNMPAIWASKWQLSSMNEDSFVPETITNPNTGSTVVVDDFLQIGETLENPTDFPAQPMSVSTVAHELGHYLGLPDLYDIRYSADNHGTIDEFPWINYDVYATSLMASGSWGRYNEGDTVVFTPVGLDPYCLTALEYIEPVDVTADGTYDVSTYWSEEGYQCLRIPTSSEDEYYLVENRQYESFDRGLTGYYRAASDEGNPNYYNETGGIVVWHIDQGVVSKHDISVEDPDMTNTVNTVDHRPGIMPVYPEGTRYGKGLPMLCRPFYNAAACEELGLADNAVSLLLYNGCETPAERVDSGISLRVNGAAGNTMSVTVSLPEEEDGAYPALVAQNLSPIGSDEELNDLLPVVDPAADGKQAAAANAGSNAADTGIPADATFGFAGANSVESATKTAGGSTLACGTPSKAAQDKDAYAALSARADEPRLLSDASYQVGDVRPFYSDVRDGDEDFDIVCVATGDDFTLWVDQENRSLVPETDLQDFAARLPTVIETEIGTFGDWRRTCDVDGDGKAAFVFYPFFDASWSGFFQSSDLLPADDEDATGNEMDVLHLNVFNYSPDDGTDAAIYDADTARSTLAHELQHLINFAQTGGRSETWLNETFSQAAVAMLGFATDSHFSGLLSAQIANGYVPPFVYEDLYVPGTDMLDGQGAYGLWLLFGRYLSSQTEGLPGGGDQVYKTILDALGDPDTDESFCTKESLVAALASMGYLGEGEGCVVRDFDELVMNFGRAYLLREASGPHSLTNDPASHPSVVDGVNVPLVLLWESADAIPGGGAIGVIDLSSDEGAAATASSISYRAASPCVRSVLNLPVPVGTRIIRDPQGTEFTEGDLISFTSTTAGAHVFYSYEYEFGEENDVYETTGPFALPAGSYCIVTYAVFPQGRTNYFRTPLLTVTPRSGGDAPAKLPEQSAPTDPKPLAPTGDPLVPVAHEALVLAALCAAGAARARYLERKR